MLSKIVLILAVLHVTLSSKTEHDYQKYNDKSENSSNDTNIEKDAIREEIKKVMLECGASTDESEKTSNTKSKRDQKNGDNNYNNRRYDYNNRRDESDYNSDRFKSSDESYNSRKSNNDRRQTSSSNFGKRNENAYERNADRYSNSNQSGRGNYNGNANNNYGNRPYYMREQSDYGGGRRDDYEQMPTRVDFEYNRDYVRRIRADDDLECISQCVFGYLEVLDDNRSPSETAIIKWLQDHLQADTKRMTEIRNVRRCFGLLASSDNEDGCEFSKSLSKCLSWDIEE